MYKRQVLPIGGIYRYRKNGETHQYQGRLIHLLQSAVGSNSYSAYKKYAEGIYNLPPINLRDLIDFRKKKLGPSLQISEVQPIEKIYWKTWKPKVTNVKVLTDLTDPKEKNRIAKDIHEQIMTREHPPKNKLTGIYGVRK